MTSNTCQLGDVADIQGGYAFKGSDFGDDGIAIIKIANIQPPVISLKSADRIPEDKLIGLDRFKLNFGDILIAMTGATIGKVARYMSYERAYLNQRVARIIPKHGEKFSNYIYALTTMEGFEQKIEALSAGSAQANISAAGIASIEVPQLSENDQLKIGKIIKNLDDRIASAKDANAIYESIAQEIFKSWFINFDPVGANSGQIGVDDISTLFPDELIESSLGMIPKGWKSGNYSDLLAIQKGSINPGLMQEKEFNHFSLPAFDKNKMPYIEMGSEIKSNKSVVSAESILISKLNPRIPRVWWPSSVPERSVCSTEFLPFIPTALSSKELVFCMLSNPSFLQSLATNATGTSSSHQRIHADDILKTPIAVADTVVYEKFKTLLAPLFKSYALNIEIIKSLVEIRRLTLPKLITGAIDVSDIEYITCD